MASFKELSLSRPLPQSSQRHHSHSMSLGAVNPNHRVTRRKSVTTAAATSAAAAAVAAATVKDPSSGESAGILMPASVNRRPSSRKPLMESSSVGVPSGFTAATSSPSFFSRSMNSPGYQDPSVAGKVSVPNQPSLASNGSTTTNTPPNPSSNLSAPSSSKNRNRRASEGAPPAKEGKRSLVEIRCERCGKGYKHGSCLSKHMWEHDPAWAITSKLLISKHQQVQLLEAASVLVTMNHDGPEESELSSASLDASSERPEGLSSADTTPPPMEQDMEEDEGSEDDEDDLEMSGVSTTVDKRYDVPRASRNLSGLFSHSYQSVPSSSFNGSAPLHSPSFSNFRHSSIETRPSTANTKLHDDDEADLAAAIGLCNFGTPRTRPVAMSPSIPPVPSLPGRFLDSGNQSQSLDQPRVPGADTAFPGSIPGSIPNFLSVSYNPSLSYKVSDEREARTGDSDRTLRQNRNADVDFGNRPAQDDDDDGVFGRMEE